MPPLHANNFNLIRMIAAALVLVSHSFVLTTGDTLLEPLRVALGVTWGSIAVDVFFVTSGFLVTASIVRAGQALPFVVNRAIRIFPGLLAALVLTTVVCSVWFTVLPFWDFWSQKQAWKYVLKNAVLLFPSGIEYKLPGTLLGVPSDHGGGGAVNGSLWTLPLEVTMYGYLVLAFLVSTFLAQWRAQPKVWLWFVLRSVALLSVAYDMYRTAFYAHDLPLHMLAMFFTGAALWTLGLDFSRYWKSALVALLLVLVASAFGKAVFLPVYTVAIPWMVLCAAYAPTPWLHRYNRIGDYSYGVYIYAFPVQQWCVYGLKGIGPWTMMAVCFPVVWVLAMLSWHLVEARALELKWRPRPAAA